MRRPGIFSAILGILFLSSTQLIAQGVKSNVSIKLERIPQEKRILLQNFDSIIEQYIESAPWFDDTYPIDITFDIQILFDRVVTSFEDVYDAKLYIASNLGYREVDKNWRFPYQKNQGLTFNQNIFDGLTGLLDFYVYIALAVEYDKYETLGGDRFFRKASQIVHYGKSDRYNKYWNIREDNLRSYTRESHKPFRVMTAALYAASYWHAENNGTEAKKAVRDTIEMLKRANRNPEEKQFLLEFFKREYKNLGMICKLYSDEFSVLMELDPEHKDYYVSLQKK